MKIYRRIISVLLAMQLLSTAAYAAGIIDLDRDVRLTVSYQDGNTPLAGAGFSKWTFAERDGREYFFKEFLSPTYPEEGAPGSERIA